MKTRAKFVCTDVKTTEEGSDVEFYPVVDGSEENESFFKYTPSGKIIMGIVNPNIKFEKSKEYYVDFTEVIN